MGKEKIIVYLRKLTSKTPEFTGQAGYYIVDSDQAHSPSYIKMGDGAAQ
jgi:hypothetical protein